MNFEGCILSRRDTETLLQTGIISADICPICRRPLTTLDPVNRQYAQDESTTTLLLDTDIAYHATCLIGWISSHGPICPVMHSPFSYRVRDEIPQLQVLGHLKADSDSDAEPDADEPDADEPDAEPDAESEDNLSSFIVSSSEDDDLFFDAKTSQSYEDLDAESDSGYTSPDPLDWEWDGY